MDVATITAEEFLSAAREFLKKSQELNDGWRIIEDNEIHKCYLKKETFIDIKTEDNCTLCKAEYVIFYNLSYGVPSFSFNVWNSSGSLLTLAEIRQMCRESIDEADFYSVITQQEHPVLQRPYSVLHPCHTAELLTACRRGSKNIIVTFLGLVTRLINFKLPMEYGLY